MKAIAAADKNWGIGYKNRLLVSIPSDMKFFRQTTTGKVVVMGRKTLESFPNGMPLKNRTNIVLTSNRNYQVKDAILVHSEEELLEELKNDRTDMLIAALCSPDCPDVQICVLLRHLTLARLSGWCVLSFLSIFLTPIDRGP